MTAPAHERPSIPLTWYEQDRFCDLVAPLAIQPRTTRYYTPRARLRRLARRVARSPMAGDVRAAWRAAFWPAVTCAGFFLGVFLLVATRGSYVAWDGIHSIPTGSNQ